VFINRISNSKSSTIDECLWKYNLKYNLKIPGFKTKSEESLRFGSFIHKVFELGYKEKDLKSLLSIAESERKNYGITSLREENTKLCLENFIVWNQFLGETISTEGEVEAWLDKEADIKFNGVIDRVVKGSKGGYLVIDYKTGKWEKKKKDLLDDKQLKGYAYAIHEKYGVEYRDIFCAHYYPLSNNYIPVQFSAFQIATWKRKEIDKVWRIRKKKANEFPPQKNIFCSNCEFQQICEKFCTKEEVTKRLDEQLLLRDQLKEARDSNHKENKK
jgi:radical SAM protein with 4Fe4S-binding SPASM domain